MRWSRMFRQAFISPWVFGRNGLDWLAEGQALGRHGGKMKGEIKGWGLALGLLIALGTSLSAQEEAKKPTKARYELPAMMMVTWADWPKDPKQQDVMAQFVKAHGFNSVEVEVDMLEMCRRNGLYARLGAGDINELLKQAAKLKDDKAVFGYFISDRRRSNSFPTFAKIARAFEKADPNHPTIFINRANWNEFGAFAEQVDPMLLDFYHYHWDGRRHPERRYIYLRSFNELGRERGIPVMRCVGGNYPIGQLRQTFYTSLAYGIQAFHFWPPWMFSYEKEGEKPVLKDGKIVPRVNVPPLAEVAKEIQPLGEELIKLRSLAVYHTKPFHPEAPGAAEFPKDHWVQASGEQIIIGMFKDAKDKDFLLVSNGDHAKERTTTLSFEEGVTGIEEFNRKGQGWDERKPGTAGKRLTLELKLSPGGGELFRIAR